MKWIQKLIGKVDWYYSQDNVREVKRLSLLLRTKENLIESYSEQLKQATQELFKSEIMLDECKKNMDKIAINGAQETYWNTKRTPVSLKYKARPIYGSKKLQELDPRQFLNPNDVSIPTMGGKDNDDIAKRCLQFVTMNIIYTEEYDNFKVPECWLYAWETMKTMKGDCEDGAILLANMMLKSGIPYWRVRLNAGSVEGGGHAWVTYLTESNEEWIILDWCYWPELSKDLTFKWKDAEDKYFSIWFSFNTKYIFQANNYDRNRG